MTRPRCRWVGWAPWLAIGLAACGGGPQPDFAAPQSVCYDESRDVYLVSNSLGGPLEKNGDAFILRVSPDDGTRTAWISAGQTGVVLNAPKGMAIVGDTLWVADIDVLRKFDRSSGAPMGEVQIPRATSLYDVAGGPDGSVYCSDSGLDASGQSTGMDAIWRVAPDGNVSALVAGVDLGQPTAIVAQRAGLYCVGWRDGAFYQVDYRGIRTDLGKAPQAKLAGLARVEASASDGVGVSAGKKSQAAWVACSWQGSTIYRFAMTGGAAPMPVRLEEAGDFCFDPKRNRLVIPLRSANRLHLEKL